MRIIFLLLISVLFTGCAKRGFITGGKKDTIAPVLKLSEPKNFSTNFKGNTIKLQFDEYVKLKDVNKQMIISPPMKTQPLISPMAASKEIKITIKDTLLENTTYSLNFGNSIQDNNEGNPYQQFKYIFSTGTYIDSLDLNGAIKDAFDLKTDNFVSVMLYEKNEKFYDSIIYKEVPRYVTNTLDSSKIFKLENLKEGNYLLVAVKDANNNNKYDPKSDKIAFFTETVTVPSNFAYELELFKEELPFKPIKPSQASENRIIVGYEGKKDSLIAELKNGNDIIPSFITPFEGKDSVQIWFKPIKTDSISLQINHNNFEKEFMVKIKNQKTDSLIIKSKKSGTLHFREKFTLSSSIPLTKIDESKIKLMNKDSVAVVFSTKYDELRQEVEIDFKKEPLEKYSFTFEKGAFTDYLERESDSTGYRVSTRDLGDYGNLRLQLEGIKSFPIIIELTNDKGSVLASAYSEGETVFDFNLVEPAMFTVRIIYDENKNKIWDTGSYLEKRQTEEVRYFPTPIEVRANWDVNQTLKFSGG
jgi:Fe-S cluster assembly iron-binding protein IscA